MLIFAVILGVMLNCHNTSKVNVISYDGNMTSISFEGEMFYDISIYGVDKGIYSESDYQRLINIDVDSDSFNDSFSVYYTDKPIAKYFLDENIIVRNFYGNDIVFITSTNDTRLLVKKNILLPEIKKSNIAKIAVVSVSGNDIVYKTEDEIVEFVDNYDYYFEKYSNELGGFECYLYYKNTDSTVYERVSINAFSNL